MFGARSDRDVPDPLGTGAHLIFDDDVSWATGARLGGEVVKNGAWLEEAYFF